MLFDNAALVHAERRVDALVFIRWDAIANVSPTNIAMLVHKLNLRPPDVISGRVWLEVRRVL